MRLRRPAAALLVALGLAAAGAACSKDQPAATPAPSISTTTVFDGTLPDDPGLTATTLPPSGNPPLAPDPQGEAKNSEVVSKLDACSTQAGGCRGMKLDFVTPAPGSDLSKRDFSGASLQGADFSDQNLEGADFRNADLAGALFIGAKLAGADFTGANLEGAIFQGSNVTDEQLSKGRQCQTLSASGKSVDIQC